LNQAIGNITLDAVLPSVKPPYVPTEGGIITVIKPVSYMIIFISPLQGGWGMGWRR